MQTRTSKWIGRFIGMLIIALSFTEASAAGFMPVEIRVLHQNGSVNVYEVNKNLLKANKTLAASMARLQNRPPDAALLSALGLPQPLNEYSHIVVSGFSSNGTTSHATTRVQSIYKADSRNTWKATTRNEIVQANSAPTFWLDDQLVADWKGRLNATKGQGVVWTQTANGQTTVKLYSSTNNAKLANGWYTFAATNLTPDGLRVSPSTPHTIYKEGEPLPEILKSAFGRSSQAVVIQKSAALKFPALNQIQAMRAIAARPLQNGTIVLDALPRKITLRNLVVNDIPPDQYSSWVNVRSKLNQLNLHGYQRIQSASKAEIIEILTRSSNDTVILVAHNSGGHLHLSGSDGDISFEEISKLRRDKNPARAIVLLTCEAGKVNGNTSSLAEIMKKNKLATAVYASPDVLDASLAADILNELHMNTTSIRPDPAGLDEVLRKHNLTPIAGIDHFIPAG